jgi:hypothetical protein
MLLVGSKASGVRSCTRGADLFAKPAMHTLTVQRDSDSFVSMVTEGESLCWTRLAWLLVAAAVVYAGCAAEGGGREP